RHGHFPHNMPVGSSMTAGAALANSVVVHRPAVPPQLLAKVQGGLLVFLIVVLPLPADVMIAVSPGWVSSRHWKLRVQTREAPSWSTTVVTPRCARMSRIVPRMPMVASPVVIL